MYQRTNRHNLQVAFDFAEDEFGVAKILDPEDVDTETPDEKSIITYVSMLHSMLPDMPSLSTHVKSETYKRHLLNDYLMMNRSLIHWLNEAITKIEGKSIPNDVNGIKNALNELKSLQLEEYATRLKEKKNLIKCYNVLMRLYESRVPVDREFEIKHIDKLFDHFDAILHKRIDQLNDEYKKKEHLKALVAKINKLNENCMKKFNQIEQNYSETVNKLDSMTSTQINTIYERLTEQLKSCDENISTMFLENQRLIDEKCDDARRLNQTICHMENLVKDLKAKLIDNIKSPRKKSFREQSFNIKLKPLNPLDNCSQWISTKRKQLELENMPVEFGQVEREFYKHNRLIMEIEQFRDRLHEAKTYMKTLNEKHVGDFKHDLNQIEIAYNLLCHTAINRKKNLEQFKDFLFMLNKELYFINEKDQIETNRDWSDTKHIDRLHLSKYKQNFDQELNEHAIIVDRVREKGQQLIDENHPASDHIKNCVNKLMDQWQWVHQLLQLLSIHLIRFHEWEKFMSECKQIEIFICEKTNEFLQLNDQYKNSASDDQFDLYINKLKKFYDNFIKCESDVCNIMNNYKSITPFRMRRQKLVYPNNRCICAIHYHTNNISIQQDECCYVNDNSQHSKWKITNKNNQTDVVPSVCFILEPVDVDCLELAEKVKNEYQNIRDSVEDRLIRYSKDKIISEFDVLNMSTDKFDKIVYDTQLKDIKTKIDHFLCEHEYYIKCNNSSSFKKARNTLLEKYDLCREEYHDLSKHFESKEKSKIQLLQIKLKNLIDKYNNFLSVNQNLSSNWEYIEKLIEKFCKEFEHTEFKSFERECEELRKNKHVKINNIVSHYDTLKRNSEEYKQSLNAIKTLLELMDSAEKRIGRVESKLCSYNQCVDVSSLDGLSTDVERILAELSNIQAIIRNKQDQSLLDQIIQQTDLIRSNKDKFNDESSNLNEILSNAELLTHRYKEICVQLTDREVMLKQVLRYTDNYRRSKNIQINWIEALEYKIVTQQQKEKQDSQLNNDIGFLKQAFNANKQIFGELCAQESQIDELNEIGIKLIQLLKRYNQLLNGYQHYIAHHINKPIPSDLNSLPSSAIVREIRLEINRLNREYAYYLKEYNHKIRLLINSISKVDRNFLYNLKLQNVDPLIDKYTKDIFDYYDLVDDSDNTQQQQHKYKTTFHTTYNEPLHATTDRAYYKDLMDINTIHIDENCNLNSTMPSPSNSTNTSSNYTNSSSYRYFASKSDTSTDSNMLKKLNYPLSFIDAVNKKQLDLETGMFRDPQTGACTVRLYDAIQRNLLNPKSAYAYDSITRKNYFLDDACEHSIITAQNRYIDRQTTQTLTLNDALKHGLIKLGDYLRQTAGGNCTLTSETQSMSVRSIKDPSTNEYLAPTEAIKRKILDPYKGLFIHPHTDERLPISDAINKGFVIVEIITDLNHSETLVERDTNLISTNLIRETKSYHLISVFDPLKNDEITIKEAIQRGILDRQRGIYIHPITKEFFSISDAINKGVIHARILMPPQEVPAVDSLVSTNRFHENRTYTICGAIDPRTHKPIGLSQAMRDGIINTQNGTYVNICTNETMTLNVAIEKGLVLTELKTLDEKKPSNINLPPTVKREIKTLTIEFVLDPRTNRKVTVTEAMHNGLLDRQTLYYRHPITNETFTLNRAYDKGFIIGHYTDSYFNQKKTITTTKTLRTDEKSYFIICILDPRTNKSLNLEQAISMGLYDYTNALYINPINKEILHIHDAIQCGFIEAKISETLHDGHDAQGFYDKRLPVGDFGIDKSIKSMRTKFNADGSSVLLIDIESTRPTRGVYEVDQFEEVTHVEQPKPNHHRTECIIDHKDTTTKSYRQVVDINSVCHIQNQQQTLPMSTSQSHLTKINIPVQNIYQQHEKNVLTYNVNKEINADFKIERNEKIIDDDDDDDEKFARNKKVLHIDVRKQQPTEIPERRSTIKSEEAIRMQTLIIDDADSRRHTANIDSELHSLRKEINLDANKPIVGHPFECNNYLHIDEEERNCKATTLVKNIKVKAEDIDDGNSKPAKNSSYLTIDEHIVNHVVVSRKPKNEVIVINDDHRATSRDKIDIDDRNVTIRKKDIYEDVYDVNKQAKPDEDEWRTEIFEQNYCVKKPKEKKPGRDEDKKKAKKEIPVKSKNNEDDDDDDRLFEEWTEVYTITLRGTKYKITWVYDTVAQERVPLIDAIRTNLIDLNTYKYRNVRTGTEIPITDAIDDGLIGIEEDKSALHIKANGITYTIYWVLDPVRKKRLSPKRAIDRGVLDLKNMYYRNYSNGEQLSIHEAISMKFIGASVDLSNIDEELEITVDSGHTYKIVWVKDTRTGEKVKPREALRRCLLDLKYNTYKRHDTNETLGIRDAVDYGFIGLCEDQQGAQGDDLSSMNLKRQDSLVSLDEDELTIKTKTAIYVITGLLHPVTQKEIKVTEAIEAGILDKDTGLYKDFRTNVVYEVGEAINEGIIFATVTDLLQDQTASTEVLREEVKRYIVKSVVDPRTQKKIGGLQAQAAGMLNYAQGLYTNPTTKESIPIGEAIAKGLIIVALQEESTHEEFDAEVVTETLMERTITNYRIMGLGVLDPMSMQMISGDEAVHKQVIDTETNSYVNGNEIIPLKEAVSMQKVKADVSERVERKPLGLSLQNAIRLGLFTADDGLFKDPYTNKKFKLNQAIDMGHINPNSSAVADSNKGMMTLNEALQCGIFDKRDGFLNRTRLAMFKARLADARIQRYNFEDAVKCGIVNLKTAKYKHMQSDELLSIKDAIARGLIDGDSAIIEHPTTNSLMTLRKALDTVSINDDTGEVLDPATQKCITTLEQAYNTRKIFSAFDENTGEIFLTSRSKIVPFEKAIRKNKMDKDVRIFDPRSNKELTINDAIEYGIIDKQSGMVIEPKNRHLISIKEACKRGVLSIVGAPLVTGHHDSETIEKATITSKKTRHLLQKFDDVHDDEARTETKQSDTVNGAQQVNGADAGRPKSGGKRSKLSRTKTEAIHNANTADQSLPDLFNKLNFDANATVNIKETNEEYRKKTVSDKQGHITEVNNNVKTNYKEAVLEPGMDKPQVISTASYETETKENPNLAATSNADEKLGNDPIQLNVIYGGTQTRAHQDVHTENK